MSIASAPYRTEISMIRPFVGRLVQKECATAFAHPLICSSPAPSAVDNEQFIIAHKITIASAAVASMTRWNKVLRRIVGLVFIDMIDYKRPTRCSSPWHPFDRCPTPMALLSVWTQAREHDAAVLKRFPIAVSHIARTVKARLAASPIRRSRAALSNVRAGCRAIFASPTFQIGRSDAKCLTANQTGASDAGSPAVTLYLHYGLPSVVPSPRTITRRGGFRQVAFYLFAAFGGG